VSKLNFKDRLLLTWQLTWPLAAIDLAVVLWLHGILDVRGETYDSIWAFAVFFVVSPWVMKRAFRRTYHGRTIVAVRSHPHQERGELRYQESLKVIWLLAWRSTVLMLIAILAVSYLLNLMGLAGRLRSPIESPLANYVGISLLDSLVSIVFTPLLIPAMLRKRFKGFSLEVEEESVRIPLHRPVPHRRR
jgi:hypothetical protein